jgi:FAD synthase
MEIDHVEFEAVTEPFEGNGRKLGYPTANIRVKTDLKDGVYFGYANLENYINQPALIFIGTPITVGATTHRVEAYLLDVTDKDYYDLSLKLTIHFYHRPNQKFRSMKKLKEVIKSDELSARQWFAQANE